MEGNVGTGHSFWTNPRSHPEAACSCVPKWVILSKLQAQLPRAAPVAQLQPGLTSNVQKRSHSRWRSVWCWTALGAEAVTECQQWAHLPGPDSTSGSHSPGLWCPSLAHTQKPHSGLLCGAQMRECVLRKPWMAAWDRQWSWNCLAQGLLHPTHMSYRSLPPAFNSSKWHLIQLPFDLDTLIVWICRWGSWKAKGQWLNKLGLQNGYLGLKRDEGVYMELYPWHVKWRKKTPLTKKHVKGRAGTALQHTKLLPAKSASWAQVGPGHSTCNKPGADVAWEAPNGSLCKGPGWSSRFQQLFGEWMEDISNSTFQINKSLPKKGKKKKKVW